MWQWWVAKKNEFFLVPNELKSPKNNMSFFVLSIFGVVGGSDPNMDKSIFFGTLPLAKNSAFMKVLLSIILFCYADID